MSRDRSSGGPSWWSDSTSPEVLDEDLEAIEAFQFAMFDYLEEHGEDRESFFAWVRSEMLDSEPGGSEDPARDERFAYWFARQFWNALPLESNGFRPRPLPPPRPGQPCPCGSGQLFESCCEYVPHQEGLPEQVMWPALARSRTEEFWIEASRHRRMPAFGTIQVAMYLFDEGRWSAAIDLLEPCFAPDQPVDPGLAEAVHMLCDAYDMVDDDPRRKEQLLQRLGADRDAGIRGSANQRLASWLHDQGRRDEAWDLIATVEQDIPGEATTAFIELTMLAQERRFEDAAALAAKRLETVASNPNVREEALDLLRLFRDDPKRGRDDYYRLSLPDPVNEFLDWIDDHRGRPRPTPRWRRLQDIDEHDESLRGAHECVVHPKARALERRWRRISGMASPASTTGLSGSEGEAWLEVDAWLPWLEAHPQALDVLSILDDIVRLLVWVVRYDDSDDRWTMWLLARGASMIARSWPSRKPGTTPWEFDRNRPGLRLLWLYAERLRANGDDRTERFERLYLRLNPNDNHGVRQTLVNRLLTDGRDAEALNIAEGYPEDLHAETAYGRVLALFRLGREDEAAVALRRATRHLPLVPDYLLRDHVETPELHEYSVRVGGEDQAWLYREDMRQVWMETDGMRRWLEAQA